MSKGSSLELYEYEAEPLKPNEVNIKVESCGICHSDISAIDGSWGISKYPMVAGHEVIGEIIGTGSDVSLHKIGDRVGLGWHSGYCNDCVQCDAGDHNFCSSTKKTVFSQHGGFADTAGCHNTGDRAAQEPATICPRSKWYAGRVTPDIGRRGDCIAVGRYRARGLNRRPDDIVAHVFADIREVPCLLFIHAATPRGGNATRPPTATAAAQAASRPRFFRMFGLSIRCGSSSARAIMSASG